MKRLLSSGRRAALASLALTGLLLSGFTQFPRTDAPLHFAIPAPTRGNLRQAAAQTPVQQYAKLPLAFEPNVGQSAAAVKFTARGDGYALFLTADEAVLDLRQRRATAEQASQHSVVRLQVVGANTNARVRPAEPLPGKSNYFTGRERSSWHTDVPNFARVEYDEIYPGVDLAFYGQQRQLEYDFIVAPGADAGQIALAFTGVEGLQLTDNGALVLATAAGELRQHAPVIYQNTPQGRQTIPGGYVLTGARQVAFQIGDYDHTQPLVIDPVFGYGTYLGGAGAESVASVALDAAGNAYLTGDTNGSVFPGTNVFPGAGDAVFVTKLDAAGANVIYTALLNGDGNDQGKGIAVDEVGNAYVTGYTASKDFPLQAPLQDKLNPGVLICPPLPITCAAYILSVDRADAFVTKLNASGNGLIFSTYLGGADTDFASGIAITPDHRIYLAGKTLSLNYPVKNEFQNNTIFSGNDSVFSVLAANGQSLVYSTYLRGTVEATCVAVDASGNGYIAGYSDGNQLETRGAGSSNPLRASNAGGTDAYVAKFNPAASGNASLVYATYLGGTATDKAFGITVDSQNRAYVTGVTGSTSFPLQAATGAAVLDATNQVNEAFVTCLNANGSGLVFSTFLGGSGAEQGNCITLDRTNNIVVGGHTTSTNFPVFSPAQATLGGARDGFVTKIAAGGTGFIFSSYVGGNLDDQVNGVRTDAASSIYLGGSTRSGNFPATEGGLQTFLQGGLDGFAAKVTFAIPETIGTFTPALALFGLRNSLTPGSADITAFFGAATDQPVVGDWNGDGVKTIGLFRDGTFFLLNRNESTGTPDLQFNFGQAGDIGLAGDWNGDGIETIGVYRPAAVRGTGTFLLRNSNSAGPPDVTISLGGFNDLPLVGDWNGDGTDTIGTYRRPLIAGSLGIFTLRNTNNSSLGEITINFGGVGDLPIVGDWDGDVTDTIGLFNNGTFTIRRFNNTGSDPANQISFLFGGSGDKPLAGDWDGLP